MAGKHFSGARGDDASAATSRKPGAASRTPVSVPAASRVPASQAYRQAARPSPGARKAQAARLARKPRASRAKQGSRPCRQPANRVLTVICLVLFLAGAAALLYPAVSNWMADRQHDAIIAANQTAVAKEDTSAIDAAWQEAVRYNESLIGQPVHDPFVPGSGYAIPANYNEVLNVNGDGVMGSIEIPKIGVDLPIYHGTGDDSLSRGVGHIESTALPIGGPSTHAVLTGHRGLPSAELFTRLDELQPGDTFVLTILGRKLAYKVTGTDTVLPDQLESLAVQDGRDLVTLVTCTPYGVNTHRLLVHAERTEYKPELERASDQGFHLSTDTIMRLAGAGLGVAVLVAIALATRRRQG